MTITLSQFIARESITITSEWVVSNPYMTSDVEMVHYKCRLSRRFGKVKRSMTTYFSMGLGLTRDPTAQDVLDCLASDSASVEQAGSFEEWCSELGYDSDSRSAERTFKVCERQAAKLKMFLGDEAYDLLLYRVGR